MRVSLSLLSYGPLAGAADTTRYVYDSIDRPIGTISPDPDGGGGLKNRAVRTTFRPDSQVESVERGTTVGQSDAAFAAMVTAETSQNIYDANSRAVTGKLWAEGVVHAATQTSYDELGRPACSATRMNPADYGNLANAACLPGPAGDYGADRITRSVYDVAGQLIQQQVGVGTPNQAAETTYTYTNNGKLRTLKDGENNLTTYEYDDHDRLTNTRHPVATKGAGTSSLDDYEQLGYDAAGNVTYRRLRDGQIIYLAYDNLDRPFFKNLPGAELDVSYSYDNLGRTTAANHSGHALTFTYDALSRNLSQAGPLGTIASQWDLAGRRTQLTYPNSALFLTYDYLVTGEMAAVRENGAASGVGVLASFYYDDLGRRVSLARGNGTTTHYGFDPVSRLAGLTQDFPDNNSDHSIGSITYNPASQIVSQVRSNDAYAWTGHYNVNRPYASNGLNQLTQSGSIIPTYDARGNLTSAGTTPYAYDSQNRLTSAGTASLAYDPLLRLTRITAGTSVKQFGYDGLDMIAEYDGANTVQRWFVHGPGTDEPLVQYEGGGLADRRWLHADERGSIIAMSNAAGTVIATNTYDEYGIPRSTNAGRFQYTGQAWLPEIGLAYYKNRMYSPTMGRFLQSDPIGMEGGINLYAYVGNDPVNFTDPLGLTPDIVVTGSRCPSGWSCYSPSDFARNMLNPVDLGEITVTGRRAEGGGSSGSGELITVTATRARQGDRCRARAHLDTVRGGLDKLALGADGASVAVTLTGIGAPAGVYLQGVKLGLEAGIGLVNLIDCVGYSNCAPLIGQAVSLPLRITPGARAATAVVGRARGAFGPRRNALGQFAPQRNRDAAAAEALQAGASNTVSSAIGAAGC